MEIHRVTTGQRRSVGELLGVWLIGARGAVATTTIVGAIALRHGHTGTVGLVTESDPFRASGLAPLDALVFGGHDLLDTPLVKAAHALCRDVGPLAPELVRLVEDELATSEQHLRPAPAIVEGQRPREFVSAVQRDLDEFRASSGARRVIVVNLATTEPLPAADVLALDLDGFERRLDLPGAQVPTSALYAYAAMDMGVPYVNFTPSKTESKGKVVPSILGYEPHTLVRIDYVPTLGDWKTAWDLIQFEGFLKTPMTLQFTWQGADSALAAPLVLDLVRLVDLAASRGERGGLGHLAFFFKSPVSCEVHDLAEQYALLCQHVKGA